jgi:Tol biopolymer transport system component
MLLAGWNLRSYAAVRLVSKATGHSGGIAANGASLGAFYNESGSHLLFSTAAGDLVRDKTDGTHFDVCLKNLTNGAITLISTNSSGKSADASSVALGLRGGRALFLSDADDLVEEDTNNLTDIFIRDTDGLIRRLGRTSPDTGSNHGHVAFGTFSDDGSRVLFEMDAFNGANTNLIFRRIYVADAASGAVTCISTNATGFTSTPANPLISSNGNVVVFNAAERITRASNVVDLVVNRAGQPAYRPNLTPGRASTLPIAQLPFLTSDAVLSADGRYLAFITERTPEAPSTATIAIYWIDLDNPADVRQVHTRVSQNGSLWMSQDGRTISFDVPKAENSRLTVVKFWNADTGLASFDSLLATVPPVSTEPSNSTSAILSPDGSHALFLIESETPAIVLPGIVLRELATGATRFVCDLPDGSRSGDLGLAEYQFTPDGQGVLLEPPAPLVADDLNGQPDLYLIPVSGGAPELITRSDASLADVSGNSSSQIDDQCLSANGRYVVFSSLASNLAPGDTNRTRDIFIKDLQSGLVSLISVSTNGGAGNSQSHTPRITPDGRFVAFLSSATDLAAGDTNRVQDAYLRDVQNGTTTLLSPRLPSSSSTGIIAVEISDSGRRAVMETQSEDMVPGLAPPGSHVFVRDVPSGTTVRASKPDPENIGLRGGRNPKISSDGAAVVFLTNSREALPARYEIASDTLVFLQAADQNRFSRSIVISRDGTKFAFDRVNPGLQAEIWVGSFQPLVTRLVIDRLANPPRSILFTPDGSRLICAVRNTNPTNVSGLFLLSADPQGTEAGFELISATPGGANGNGLSDSPSVSGNGRLVAFQSDATDLVPGDDNGFRDVFVRDLVNGQTVRLFENAGERSYHPTISSDGRFVVFNSLGMAEPDRNGFADVVIADVPFSVPLLLRIVREGNVHQLGFQLGFPTSTENRYRVERRGSLIGESWQSEGAEFDGDGSDHWVPIPADGASAGFYRVTARPR